MMSLALRDRASRNGGTGEVGWYHHRNEPGNENGNEPEMSLEMGLEMRLSM